MRILIVQNTDWLKRNPGQQHHLAEMLALRGHKIRVIDFEILWRAQPHRELLSKRKVFENVSKIYKNTGIMTIRPSIVKIPLLDYISMMLSHKMEIQRQIREFSPDIILSFGIVAFLAGRAAKRNHIPFVYYWIDVSHRLIPFKFIQPLGWIIERRAIKSANRIIAINEELCEYVVSIGAPRSRAHVLRAGIDFTQFDLKISGNSTRKKYGLKKQDTILFFMGWLYEFSGLKEVTLQLAKSKDPNLKLLIVGEGDIYLKLQQLQEQYNLRDRLILAGRQPYSEIPKFLAAADICLLPAYPKEKIMQNIVPIKMYEYMAMGKPVVSSRLPGVLKEFGQDNGVVYVERPEDAVGKALEIMDNNNLERLGRKARSYVEKYSWVNITSEFESILRETMGD
jgi:glycosyltransferase involved in cell wall biosynthesis